MNPRYVLYKIKNTRRGEYFERLKSGFKHYVRQYPTTVIIQTVTACNLPCTHCFINNFGKEIADGKKNIMQMEKFRALTEKLRTAIQNADSFSLSTFEALMNKHFFEMFDHMLGINPKLKMALNSNGMLLNEETVLRLTGYPLSEINISVDGLKKETVESFKTGVSHDQVINALGLLKKHGFAPIMAVGFVAHRDNIAEFPEYVDFMHGMGVKRIYVNNLLSFTGLHKGRYLYTAHGNAYAETIFREAAKRAVANGQELWLPGLTPKITGCTASEMLFVTADGDVAPCDFLSVSTPFEFLGESKVSEPVIFGNVFQEDALRIFKSKSAKTFRNTHRDNRLPGPCSHCIDGHGLMCSKRTLYV